MTNSCALREIIKEKGLKLKFLAEQIGVTPAGFSKKIENELEFKPSEIKKLCDVLGLNRKQMFEIFFANNVD